MPVLSWIVLLLALTSAVPLVRRFLLPGPGQWAAALAAGFGAGVGGLTLWMLFLGLLPGGVLSALSISVLPAALGLAGLWLAITNYHSLRLGAWLSGWPARFRRLTWPERCLLLGASAALAVTLAHALYYPFVGEDEVSRYAYFARLIFAARGIPREVAEYPLLLPLGYAYAFFLSGGLDEHLAKIVSWGFAPAAVAATYWLAAQWAGPAGTEEKPRRARQMGLIAAFTLAVTRLFVDWSPMGYVDIPTGLYFALAGGFAALWLQRPRARFALAAGAAAGLALWTKQAGFAAALSLGLVFFAAGLFDNERRSAAWRDGLAALALAALIGLPWYARNLALGGWESAVPGPGGFYYEQARRSPLDWLPFLGWAEEFGYAVAPLYLFGLFASAAALIWPAASRAQSIPPFPERPASRGLRFTHYALRPAILLQLAFLLPYLVLWWGWFSYDPRFLLTVLPFYAALVGLGFGWVADRVALGRPSASREPAAPPAAVRLAGSKLRITRYALRLLAIALVTGLVFSGVYWRLGGAYRLLTVPFATDEEKLLHYKPDVASTVAFLRTTAQPGHDRIYSMDPRLAYYLMDYEVTAGYPTRLAQLEGYAYLVAGSWAFNDVYPRLGAADNEVAARLEDPQVLELLFTSELGTVKVYRVVERDS